MQGCYFVGEYVDLMLTTHNSAGFAKSPVTCPQATLYDKNWVVLTVISSGLPQTIPPPFDGEEPEVVGTTLHYLRPLGVPIEGGLFGVHLQVPETDGIVHVLFEWESEGNSYSHLDCFKVNPFGDKDGQFDAMLYYPHPRVPTIEFHTDSGRYMSAENPRVS